MVKNNGDITVNDYEKAERLNDYFASVFLNENLSNLPTINDKSKGLVLSDIDITVENVLKKLSNLDVNKSMGPNNLHPHFFKSLAFELSYPVYLLYKK